MQQVAAHKTDLAALPFAATNTAKAVETGIDSQSKNQNSDAFKSLYQEARSSNNNASTQRETSTSSKKQSNKQDSDKYYSERQTDGTSNRVDRNENVEREVKKSPTNNQHDVNHRGQDESQGNTANHAQSAAKQGKDKNAGHTDLPTNDKSDDIALSGGTGVSGEGAEDTAVQAIDLHGNPVGGEAQQEDSTDRELVNGLPVEDSAVEGEPIAGKPGEGDIIVDNPIGFPLASETIPVMVTVCAKLATHNAKIKLKLNKIFFIILDFKFFFKIVFLMFLKLLGFLSLISI